MTKLEQIEAALRAVDAATVQRLGDAYLRCRGYRDLHPIGLAFGSAKTATGTPDTLVARPDGRFGFVEYSTQQGGLAERFADDLAKCFDENKTGAPAAPARRTPAPAARPRGQPPSASRARGSNTLALNHPG
jgi:hypothetical protein